MPAGIELGLFLSSAQMGASGAEALGFEQLVAIVREAEDAGFHSVWWPDHYFIRSGPNDVRGSFECWTLMTALAARTSRIKLGSLVLCNSFRHPALLAKQAASLQEISGGRVILGLGSGWHEPEYQALGLPFDRRVGRLEESATAIRELLDTGTSSFEGRWVKLDDAVLLPRPQVPVPLWIAARQPRILGITAKLADGWNLAWYGADPAGFAGKAEELRTAIAAAGRPADAVDFSVGIQALVTEPGGEEAALAALKQEMPAIAQSTASQIQRQLLIGDPATVAAGLRAYAAAGAGLAIIGAPGLAAFPSDQGALKRLLHDVPAALSASA